MPNTWTIFIDEQPIQMELGCLPHEKGRPQTLYLSVRAEIVATPAGYATNDALKTVYDYGMVMNQLLAEWPARAHTNLLETLAAEAAEKYLVDERVTKVWIRLRKESIYPDSKGCGVELERSR